MQLKFWGTRGSIAVPGKETIVYGGNTTCIELTLRSGHKVIIDAGTGIRALGARLTQEDRAVDIHLLITHIHWDHVQGFPFFAPIFDPRSKIAIDGHPACMKGLRYTFDNKMGDGFFPIKFSDLKAGIRHINKLNRGPLVIEDTLIESIPLQHPQGGYGFRFREDKHTLVFITDNELNAKPRRMGKPFPDYAAFAAGADLLIHDAQYTPMENAERQGWGHSDYLSACELARSAGVKKLVLFHHDPLRTDEQQAALTRTCQEWAQNEKSDLIVESARETDEMFF